MLGDVLREAARSIRAHKLRFGLTSLGMVWGVAMLTYLSASSDGYDQHFAKELEKVGQRVVFLWAGVITKNQVGQRGAREVELELEDIDRLGALQGLESAGVNQWVGALMVRAHRRTKLVWTWGVSGATAKIRNFEAEQGRLPDAADVKREANVVFLGSKAARRLFGNRPAVGRTVHMDGIPFRVIGVSAAKGEQLISIGPLDDEVALIPITTAQRWFLKTDKVDDIILRPRNREVSWDAGARAKALLGLHHGFAPKDETAMGYFNVLEATQIVEAMLLGVRIFLSAASLITLFVGAIGVMNIMLVVVHERTKEIGLRKAIGASNRAIFTQFLSETLLITLLSGALGAFLGWLAVSASAASIPDDADWAAKPILEFSNVVFIFCVLVGAGLLAGLLPAARASRIDPAISLRAI